MNFFKNLPLTTKILAGAAGVGAAALVGYGILTAPEDGGNAFFDNGRQRVEYVAGASNGVPEQDLISSRNVKFMDEKYLQEERQREALEMGNDLGNDNPVTYGPLGTGDMPTEGASISHGPMGLVNGGMVEDTGGMPSVVVPGMGDFAGIVGGAAGAGVQGSGPGAGGEGGAGGTQRATLERVEGAKALKAPGANGFGNGIGGGHQNPDNVWTPGVKEGNGGDANKGLDLLNKAAGMVKEANEGAQLAGKPVNNKPRFGTRDNPLSRAALDLINDKCGNDLECARRTAKHLAKREDKLATLSEVWLGDTQHDGFKLLSANNLSKLGMQNIDDAKFKAGLVKAGSYIGGALSDELGDREKDGNSLKKHLWLTFAAVLAIAIAIPVLKCIPLYGHIIAGIAFGLGLLAIASLGVHIGTFSHKWNFEGIAITSTVLGGIMTAGLVLSWVKWDSWLLIQAKGLAALGVNNIISVATALAGAGVAAGAAGAVTAGVGVYKGIESLKNGGESTDGANTDTIGKASPSEKKDISSSGPKGLANK